MNHLTTSNLLQVWERGLSVSSVHRALYLLSVGFPDYSWEDLTQLSIGRRDALLLTLREWLFGTQLASVATCPNCGEELEFTFSTGDVRVSENRILTTGSSLEMEGYIVHFRLPNSLDLDAVAHCSTPAAIEQQLLQRCIMSASYQKTDCEFIDLPETILDTLTARIAKEDPQADIEIALTCPACDHQWQSPFDILQFLWHELHAWAQRTLVDVHRLASAYGWREADILAMAPQRRQIYLGMVNR
ncbi:MAG: phage baseplate protein [Cyanobacteria bacterium P01_F01_bin.13]